MGRIEEEDIVIVGAGIAGLATSLALHRKGIRSVVLERSDSIRITGTNLNVYTNGWLALEQLGMASKLRSTAICIHRLCDVDLDDRSEKRTPIGKQELRCLRRRDVIESLAKELPPGTIFFSHHIVRIDLDSNTSYPTLQLHDGSIIKAKVVIGCDGVNSVVSKYLNLKTPMFESTGSLRGFTSYPNGHGLDSEFLQMKKGNTMLGRAPVDEKLVCWFIGHQWYPECDDISKDSTSMHQFGLRELKDFPSDIIEMVRKSDIKTLSLLRFRHRQLKELALSSFNKGNVVVAGDAMHVIGPYFGQGGSSALEDAIVLVRCMLREMRVVGPKGDKGNQMPLEWGRAEIAFDKFVKERRLRVLCLSLRAYVIGRLADPSTSFLLRFICILMMILVFNDVHGQVKYDCGKL